MFFEVFSVGIWGASSPLCINGHKSKFSTAFDECSLSLVKVLLNFFFVDLFPPKILRHFRRLTKLNVQSSDSQYKRSDCYINIKIFHPTKKIYQVLFEANEGLQANWVQHFNSKATEHCSNDIRSNNTRSNDALSEWSKKSRLFLFSFQNLNY